MRRLLCISTEGEEGETPSRGDRGGMSYNNPCPEADGFPDDAGEKRGFMGQRGREEGVDRLAGGDSEAGKLWENVGRREEVPGRRQVSQISSCHINIMRSVGSERFVSEQQVQSCSLDNVRSTRDVKVQDDGLVETQR